MFNEINFENIIAITYIIKTFFITICTYFTFLKITNEKVADIKLIIKSILFLFIISILTTIFKYNLDSFVAIAWLVFSIGILGSITTKNNIGYSILISAISLSFNNIAFFIAVVTSFMLNMIIKIENDIINLTIILSIYMSILYLMLKVKKLKNGIIFFNKKLQDDYFDLIILNVSVSILLSTIIFSYINIEISRNLIIGFIIFAIIMVITIYRTLQLYYKHKLLVKELEETKAELDNAKKDIVTLEEENLNISKKNHSLAHKQKSLEHKIDKLMLKTETAEEIDVKNKLDNISKELYVKGATVELTKTEINEVDDMLDCMKSECEKNNIDFDLQLAGNIYHMVNNLVSKDELSTLIADHVKDAIIAINHTDNINRSILVRLGEIDDCFGLYIYDTGIEFEKETLKNIGKRPYTTHKDEDGTGLGFMNTFETLRKHKATLIIEEIGKPCKDNFTKIIKIKFDGKDQFQVISYKEK